MRLGLFSTIALGLLLSTPLAAQTSPSGGRASRTTPPPQQSESPAPAAQQGSTVPATRAEVLRAAICLVGSGDAAAAEQFLATPPYSQQDMTAGANALRFAQRCMRVTSPIRTTAMTFRGAVAEALYKARFAEPQAARTPPLGVAPLLQPAAASDQAIVARITNYHTVAECAVTRSQDLIRALLATEPGAPTEQPALEALYPTFTRCVPPGTRLSIDPGVMRGVLAETLYRWSVVQRDGPTSPWAAAATPAPASN